MSLRAPGPAVRPQNAAFAGVHTMETLDRLSLLSLELQRGARREPAADFMEWAFGALKQQLPFDTAMWASGYLEPGQAPVLLTAQLHRQPSQMLVDYAAIGGSDVLLTAAVSQPGTAIAADTPTWAPPQVLDYLQRYGIAHALATCTIDPQTRLITGISLWRADAARPYAEPERQLMQAVFAHLIEARTQNRLLQLVQAANPRVTLPWRPAAADATGLLHHADDEFVRLLPEEWPGWTGPYLPDPLRQALREGVATRVTGRQLVFKLAPLGDLTLVQVRRCAPLDRLTAREREVAMHTAQGLTHKEIARLLALSPATVRTHLASSCRRIGVRNKAQLAAVVNELE
jgi:DNA-binding CsgD family transcriptional regulator